MQHASEGLTLTVAVVFILPETADLVRVVVVRLVLVADIGDAAHVVGSIRQRQRADIRQKLARHHLHRTWQFPQVNVGARTRQRIGCHPTGIVARHRELGQRNHFFARGRRNRWG